MRNVDPIRVRSLLGSLHQALGLLEQLGALPLDEFLADRRNTESAKYSLIVATESAIDICNHVTSHSAVRAPSDYADCFRVLVELRAIDAQLAARLQLMARFRNRLVHLYAEIDNERVYEILHNNLADFEEYARQIVRFVRGA